MAILEIQTDNDPVPLKEYVDILSSALMIASCIKSSASAALSVYRQQIVFTFAAYRLYSSSSAIMSLSEQYLASSSSLS